MHGPHNDVRCERGNHLEHEDGLVGLGAPGHDDVVLAGWGMQREAHGMQWGVEGIPMAISVSMGEM